ncbi:hypothetical protein C4K24_0344 [Pseudomonas chlororaphis subsp. aurantiaca]|uniref:hypothetical protein n=1 Tax=Pseudomonas chlororaphis TaxID=587753 RepID=UPI000F56445A|nr:hypothetical protein [Pseudomonas chlororaphis]AZD19678.1 hypothetical protein C4K24_0344 [Pseudomonas chlororaphis subsp. aurantiaca]
MAHITLPDGSLIIDDSELMPEHQARRMAHEGMQPAAIASELGESLADVQQWIQEAPYETPEAYWLRRYNEGTHRDDDE